MAITKTEILAAINLAFEASYSDTDRDIEIQMMLDDLAKMHVLKASDATQTLVSGSFYLTYPTDALDTEQAIISVVLTDSSSVACAPLKHLPGGWQEYNYLMQSYSVSGAGEPAYMVRHDRKIYLYPDPSESYTATIWYYRRHSALATTMDFTDDWRNCLYFGACYFTALMGGDSEGVGIWESRYYTEKERMRMRIPREMAIEDS